MKCFNQSIIIGHLGKDPEVRFTGDGKAVANFSVATNESWLDKEGNKQERTEWHKVVAWGKLGEICGEYLFKGNPVFIEGKLQTREWEDREGNKRYTTEIVVSKMIMLGAKDDENRDEGADDEERTDKTDNDEVPF